MINVQKLGFTLIILCLGVYILIQTQMLIVPWFFAIFFTLLLIPVCQFYERLLKRRVLSIFLTFLTTLIPISLLLYFFSWQLSNLGDGLPDISEKITEAVDKIFQWTNQNLGISKKEGTSYLEDNLTKVINDPGAILREGFVISSTFVINFFLVLIYVFFLLWYRTALKSFILLQFSAEYQKQGRVLLSKIQKTVYQYIFGLLKVIMILAILNSLGLWIIGIKYAIFWGVLAAFLAIVPYIGSTIGGLLPFLYALATTGNFWQPAAVIIYYQVIQQIEGNFITPYIIGSNLKINPLVAICSLLAGGLIWGIPGLILALPLVAVLRIIMDHTNRLKPLAKIFSDQLGTKEGVDWKNLDQDKHRLSLFFFNKKE